MARGVRARMATPLYVFCPEQTARYPAASSSAAGNLASSSLISCSAITSTRRAPSHSSSCGKRTLRELTFHVAIDQVMSGRLLESRGQRKERGPVRGPRPCTSSSCRRRLQFHAEHAAQHVALGAAAVQLVVEPLL